MDVVEVNPSLAETEEQIKQTTTIGCSLARAGMGETLL
jgi:arginase family enzyme